MPPVRSATSADATRDIAGALTTLVADMFALYLKTKNFEWHACGPHLRDYHLIFEAQSRQILATFDAIAERVRKVGGTTLRSVGHIQQIQHVLDNDAEYVPVCHMLAELREDNIQLAARMREAHALCEGHGDVATTSLIETWIDQAERRIWWLFEVSWQARGFYRHDAVVVRTQLYAQTIMAII
jgi:starvation-inducible DNA-binding protein